MEAIIASPTRSLVLAGAEERAYDMTKSARGRPIVLSAHGPSGEDPSCGSCELERCWDDRHSETWLYIVRADPRIVVDFDFLDTLANDQYLHSINNVPMDVDIWLDLARPQTPRPWKVTAPEPDPLRTADHPYYGALLHIDGRDRRIVYRIGHMRWSDTVCEAAWPD